MFETLQFPIVAAAILVAFAAPSLGLAPFSRLERGLRRIADRPVLSSLLIAAVAVLARVALIPFLGTTQVTTPDEASILLQAQTYAAGHFANPGPPLPPSFESFYVILQPAYASMYPVLRAGPMVLSHLVGLGYWSGVLLTVAALSVSTYWLVRAFRMPRYALVCAALVVLRYGLFSVWVNSYESAAFTALGGVLLVLGYKRLSERSSLRDGALFGLGLFILMTTRPFEGLVFSAPFLAALSWRAVTSRAEPLGRVAAAAIVVGILVALGLGLTLYSNQAITGGWRLFPYSLYRNTYAQTPAFLFQHAVPGVSVHYDLTRRFFDWESGAYFHSRGLKGLLGAEQTRIRNYWDFYVGFALLIPFGLGLYALRKEKVLAASAIALGAGLAVETWNHAHYASPLFGVIVLAIAFGLRDLRHWTFQGRPVGAALSRTLLIALAVGELFPLWTTLSRADIGNPAPADVSSSCCWLHPTSIHSPIDAYLDGAHAAKRIVFVDTGPSAPQGVIVFNAADLQDAATIWVNDDPAYDATVRSRFPGRQAWRLSWAPDYSPCLTRMADIGPGGLPATSSDGSVHCLQTPGLLGPRPSADAPR